MCLAFLSYRWGGVLVETFILFLCNFILPQYPYDRPDSLLGFCKWLLPDTRARGVYLLGLFFPGEGREAGQIKHLLRHVTSRSDDTPLVGRKYKEVYCRKLNRMTEFGMTFSHWKKTFLCP